MLHSATGNTNPAAIVRNHTLLQAVCAGRFHDISRKAGRDDLKWQTLVRCFEHLAYSKTLQNNLLSLWVITRSMMLMLSFTEHVCLQDDDAKAPQRWIDYARTDPDLKQWKKVDAAWWPARGSVMARPRQCLDIGMC